MEEEQQHQIFMASTGKGKRTKRLRLLSPCGGVMAAASSCSSVSGGDTFSSSTESEEEDMANCLILLARGGSQSDHHHHRHEKQAEHRDDDGDEKTEKGNTTASKRFSDEVATATNTNSNTKVGGFFIYECKTCNRTFPSFQALGGHRASHKRPKVTVEEKKLSPPRSLPPPSPPPPAQLVVNYGGFEEMGPLGRGGPSISLQLGRSSSAFHHPNNNKANKIHECSICGSEFTSGQALGGHMRRHRASATTTATAETNSNAITVRPRNILQLDLNLPAPPEDDLRESKFQFTATQKPMVLSAAPALVDCHY